MSREKQIEEIAKILLIDCEGACTDCEYYGRYDGSLCIPMRLANELYKQGYRKQSEGEWIDKPTGAYSRMQSWCSACGKHSGIGGIESNRHKPYCPNCGAKMKGGAE
jgi:hypothetical protein